MNPVIIYLLARSARRGYTKAFLEAYFLAYAVIAALFVVGIGIHILRYLHFFGYDDYITMMLWVSLIPLGIMLALLTGFFITTRQRTSQWKPQQRPQTPTPF